MSVTRLNCGPLRLSLHHHSPRIAISTHGQISTIICNGDFRGNLSLNGLMQRCNQKSSFEVRCSMDASLGNTADDTVDIFPRINVKDPYKRLGIDRKASEEEIQAARNFLVNKYASHRSSVDAIESAHDKIIMQSLLERRRPKLDIKKKMRDLSHSSIVKAVTSRFETPSKNIIIKTAAAFIVLGALTFLFPTEEGPTLQVAVSLIVSVYFIYNRLKSHTRAVLYGVGVFLGSWLLGTFLMVSVVPPILHGPRSLEVTTSLLSYIFLWFSSAYLK